jgi:hypothetical protein
MALLQLCDSSCLSTSVHPRTEKKISLKAYARDRSVTQKRSARTARPSARPKRPTMGPRRGQPMRRMESESSHSCPSVPPAHVRVMPGVTVCVPRRIRDAHARALAKSCLAQLGTVRLGRGVPLVCRGRVRRRAVLPVPALMSMLTRSERAQSGLGSG